MTTVQQLIDALSKVREDKRHLPIKFLYDGECASTDTVNVKGLAYHDGVEVLELTDSEVD